MLLKKNLEYESILYNSNYRLTGNPENFKIKLFYFQERLSYNNILKTVSDSKQSLFHSYMFLAKKITSKRTYFLKSIPEVEDLHFNFYIIDHSVCDQLLQYLK